MISDFTNFKRELYSIFPREYHDTMFFSQTLTEYNMAFKPDYPDNSYNDLTIRTIDKTGAYLRGNYEICYYDPSSHKFEALYCDSFGGVFNQINLIIHNFAFSYNLLSYYISQSIPIILQGDKGTRLFCPSSELYNISAITCVLGELTKVDNIMILPYRCYSPRKTKCPIYNPNIAKQPCQQVRSSLKELTR